MDFKSSKQPFAPVPDLDAWYPVETMKEAERNLFRCLDCGEGIALVFGENGAGKTLLFYHAAELFGPDDFVIVPESRITDAESFLQQILYCANQTWCGCTKNELRLLLRDYIDKTRYARIILLLDNAQYFKYSVFEELRSLLDIHRDGEAYIRIALAGTSKLEERLTHPKLAPFQQRVVSRSWLEPFSYAETQAYLVSELKRPQIFPLYNEISFSKEAVKLVYHKTDGNPRLINQLGKSSVNIFISDLEKNGSERVITEETVRRAWSGLQQIPIELENKKSPSDPPAVQDKEQLSQKEILNGDKSPDIKQETIEFGALDDKIQVPFSDKEEKKDCAESNSERIDEISENKNFEKSEIISHEIKGEDQSFPTEGIIEFGALSEEDHLEDQSDSKEDLKDEGNTKDLRGGLVWEIELDPMKEGAQLTQKEDKSEGRQTEQSLSEGEASVLSVDKEVTKLAKFVSSNQYSEITIGSLNSENLSEEQREIEIHEAHEFQDMVQFPGSLTQISGRLHRFNDEENVFNSLNGFDLQIEKAHSAAFDQKRQEEIQKKDRSEKSISSVFRQVYEQKNEKGRTQK